MHTRRIWLVCACTLGTVIATSSHSAIFARDDRRYLSPTAGSPYSPVGLVVAGSSMKRSTGFLVDPCHVLTGEAVLGAGLSPLGRRAKFKAGIGTPRQVTTGATVIAVGGSEKIQSSAQQSQAGGKDWLLLHLDKCVGATFGYVTLNAGPFSPQEFRDLQSAGYPMGRSIRRGLTLDPSCNLLGSWGTVWTNDCALTRGDEGDPIFRLSTSGGTPRMEVYAMQSAGYIRKQPVSMVPGYENQAVPISLIAPQIVRYLALDSQRQAGREDAAVSKASHALSNVSGSAGLPSDRRMLGARVGAADDKSHLYGGAK